MVVHNFRNAFEILEQHNRLEHLFVGKFHLKTEGVWQKLGDNNAALDHF